MAAPKVAIVHDWMVTPGGGERVVYELHKIWPEAPVYTSAYDPEKFPEFKDADVRTTWLNGIGLARRKQQLFTIPRAWAFKGLDLSDYDIVISSCSAESKYVKVGLRTLHVCYCHTPIRYYWSDYGWYRKHPPFGWLNPLAKLVLPLLIPMLRRMDYNAAQKVHIFVANSNSVRERIRKYYDRHSEVIFPPVDTAKFHVGQGEGEYYLVFGRQVAYKRLDLAVRAFNELGEKLVVGGGGEEINRQKPRAKANIRFMGRVPEGEVADLFAKAKALIWPQEEDFGITAVEMMAAGRPVIAYAKGGAFDYVIDGVTGVLFHDQSAESLAEAVKKSQRIKWDRDVIRKHAEKYDNQVFAAKIKALVDREYQEFQSKGA
ncbi:MAG TPA: glycosyltransferase [Candidatus Nanoarchaeia archaeon]|nr:glycosyltransferase [Candidatus Nanoarchaeia archaeon]